MPREAHRSRVFPGDGQRVKPRLRELADQVSQVEGQLPKGGLDVDLPEEGGAGYDPEKPWNCSN
jgi:hypothetical protein